MAFICEKESRNLRGTQEATFGSTVVPGCRIGETDIPDFLGAGHRYWVFKSRTGDDSSLIWTFIHCSVSFRSA